MLAWQRRVVILTAVLQLLTSYHLVSGVQKGKGTQIWMPMLQHVLAKCSFSSPLFQEAISQLNTCAFGPLKHCLFHKNDASEGVTELSKFCGWVIIGGRRVEDWSLPKKTRFEVLSNAKVNLTFTHFDVPWRGPRCPSVGVKVFKPPGDVLGVYCGRRVPWSLAVPNSQFSIRVFGHPSARAVIHVIAFYEVIPVKKHILQDEPAQYFHEKPLKYVDPQNPIVGVLPSVPNKKRNLQNTWHILTFPIKFLKFRIKTIYLAEEKMVIYDGPGSKSPVVFTQDDHSPAYPKTTGFHATIIVVRTLMGKLQQANVQYMSASHFLKSELSPPNRCSAWYWFQRETTINISASTSATENTICMTRYMALDSNNNYDLTGWVAGSIELTTTAFTFTGPSTYDNDIDFECQYGGVYVYYGDVTTSVPLKWFHFCGQEGAVLPKVLVLDFMVLIAVWFNGYSSGQLQATLRPSKNCDSHTAVARDAPVSVFLSERVCNFIFTQFRCDLTREQESCIIIVKSPVDLNSPIGIIEIMLMDPVNDSSKSDVHPLFFVVWFTKGGGIRHQLLNSGGNRITGPQHLEYLGLMVAANASNLWNAASFEISQISSYLSFMDTEGKDTKISLDNSWGFFAMMPYTQHTLSVELSTQKNTDTRVLFIYKYGCPLLCRNDTFKITERHNNTVSVVFTWTGSNMQFDLFSFHREHISSSVTVGRQPVEGCAQLQHLCAAQIDFWFEDYDQVEDFSLGRYTLHHPPLRGLTWMNAENNCVREGGHLLSTLEHTRFRVEMAATLRTMSTHSHPSMDVLLYIGLNDQKVASHYAWTDGSAVSVQFWTRPNMLPTKAEYSTSVGKDRITASDGDLSLDQEKYNMQSYINKLLQKHQPTTDKDERCSAMVVSARGDISGWVKLPCSKSLQANYICFVPRSNVTHSFRANGITSMNQRRKAALSSFHSSRSRGEPHLIHPSKACPEKWFLFGAICYTLATVRKPVYARDMETTCRRLGGRPLEVLDKRELAEDLGKQLYFCVERNNPAVCNPQTYLGLTAAEYRWARDTVDSLTSHKLPFTSVWAIKAKILQQGVPISLRDIEKVMVNGSVVGGVWRRKRNYYYGYSDYYDQSDWTYNRYGGLDYEPDSVSLEFSEEFSDLKDFLKFIIECLPADYSRDGSRELSFAVKTMMKGQGLLSQDHSSDTSTWLFSENQQDEQLHATYILCQAEPSVHEEACTLPQRQCKDGTCILQTRFCDKRVDCVDGSDEESCESINICKQADMFQCLSGDCIPLHLLCDGRPDCTDNSDETYCVFPSCNSDEYVCEDGSCIPSDAVCDGIEHCNDRGDEMDCDRACKGFSCHDSRCIFWSRVNDGFPDCAFGEDEPKPVMGLNTTELLECYGQHLSRAKLSCQGGRPSGPPPCFDIGDMCLLKEPLVCPNGGNIMNCHDLDCSGMFKCGITYCIPVFRVCDGHMDCPFQADERDCNNIVCPGLLKCSQEEVCVAQVNICDGLSQCTKSNDDEVSCFPCPKQCQCGAYTMTCDFRDSLILSARALFVKYLVLQNVPKIFAFETVADFSDLVYLKILKGTFNAFSRLRNKLQKLLLQVLIISRTELWKVSRSLLQGMPSLQFLDMSDNRVSTFVERSFEDLHHLQVLNLANNNIRILLSEAFSALSSLKYLNLDHNRVLYIEPRIFEKLEALQYLRATVLRIYCFAPRNIAYSGEGKRSSFCSQHLFERGSQRAFAWIYGLTGLFGNAVVAYLVFSPKSGKGNSKRRYVYRTLVVNTLVADGLMEFYVTCLAIVDLYFQRQFSSYVDAWKVHAGCRFLGFLSLFSFEASLLTTLLIAAFRLSAVVYPIRFYQAAGKQRLTSSACLTVCSLAATFAFLPLVPFQETIENVSPMPNSACMLLSLDGEISKEATYFWCVLQAVNSVAVLLIVWCYSQTYSHLYRVERRRKKELLASDQRTLSQMLLFALRVIKTLLADWLIWLPSIAFMGISLASNTFSGHVEMWVAIAVLPLKATFSPLLFIINHIAFPAKNR